MEKHFAIFSDDQPQIGDFVYNATAGTVDRVTDFDTVTRYSPTKQCTIEAARDYGHQVIDLEILTQPGVIKTLKTLEVMGTMKHTKYSDSVILREVEEGEYKFIKEAFKRAADNLAVRITQVQARYYGLRNDGITLKDVEDYTEQDEKEFDPGDGEKIERGSREVKRPKQPEGYGQPWKSYQSSNAASPLDDESDSILEITLRPKEMKTVLVTYTTQQTPLTEKQIRENKLYAFNTPSEMKKGDIIKSDSYTTPMQVVEVLDKPSTYYNRSTGELSDVFTSTEQRKLATLIIREDDSNTVYAKFVAKKV